MFGKAKIAHFTSFFVQFSGQSKVERLILTKVDEEAEHDQEIGGELRHD